MTGKTKRKKPQEIPGEHMVILQDRREKA